MLLTVPGLRSCILPGYSAPNPPVPNPGLSFRGNSTAPDLVTKSYKITGITRNRGRSNEARRIPT